MTWWQRLLDWLGGNRPVTPPTPPVTPTPTPPPGDNVQQMLTLHNDTRARLGLPPLVNDARLNAAAQGHSNHMASRGLLEHQGIGDGDPWIRIRATGYRFAMASENLASGSQVPVPNDHGGFDYRNQTAAEAFAALMADPPHQANVVGRFKELGVGVAIATNGWSYWTCDYATPA